MSFRPLPILIAALVLTTGAVSIAQQKAEKPKQTFGKAIGKKPFISKKDPAFAYGAKGKKYKESMKGWLMIDVDARKGDLLEQLDAQMEKAQAMEDGSNKTSEINRIEEARGRIARWFKGARMLMEKKNDSSEWIRVAIDEVGNGTKLNAVKQEFRNQDAPITDQVITTKAHKRRGMQVHRLDVKFGTNEKVFARLDTYMIPARDKSRIWVVRYMHVMPASRYKATKEMQKELYRLSAMLRI
ncbi:MAG: hypothetical protein AAF581_21770 [Planctomycetota bacterium]